MEAAFFDLDKTVIARSSTLAFGKPLFKEGFIGRADLAKGIYAQLVYLISGADEDKMEKMRVALLERTKGWEQDRLSDLVQETLSEVIDPIIYSEAMDLIEEHRAAGRRVYIVSSSAEEIVLPVASFLGIDHAIATRPTVEDGRYTGELDFYCYGEGKREAILAEAETQSIDLTASFAYSDSVTDVPMLETVGNPHAVNPDKELRAIAEERGWTILEFENPVSVRQRLRDRGTQLAERGRIAAESGARFARDMPRVARDMPRRAREASPPPLAMAAVAGAIALLVWLIVRKRQTAGTT